MNLPTSRPMSAMTKAIVASDQENNFPFNNENILIRIHINIPIQK